MRFNSYPTHYCLTNYNKTGTNTLAYSSVLSAPEKRSFTTRLPQRWGCHGSRRSAWRRSSWSASCFWNGKFDELYQTGPFLVEASCWNGFPVEAALTARFLQTAKIVFFLPGGKKGCLSPQASILSRSCTNTNFCWNAGSAIFSKCIGTKPSVIF